MFRKLKENISSAADALLTGGEAAKVNALVALGFSPDQARGALRTSGGNVDQAAELLMSGGGEELPHQQQHQQHQLYARQQQQQQQHHQQTQNDDDELQRAMQASLQEEEFRLIREAQIASTQGQAQAQTPTPTPASQAQQPQALQAQLQPTIRSAASSRAGQAALARFEDSSTSWPNGKKKKQQEKLKSAPTTRTTTARTTAAATTRTASTLNGSTLATTPHDLAVHHPDVQVPKKLQDKSKEEQVLRCADRLKSSPRAVDTLYISLTALRNNPNDDKYRTIDTTTAGYQRSLATAPGAEDFLRAMNYYFTSSSNKQTLYLSHVDPALLYLGISALEETRKTKEYISTKQKIKFQKDVRDIVQLGDTSEQEALLRSNFLSKCPSEPSDGRGALVQVVLGDDITIRRRFDGDDTLEDILNFIGAHGSSIHHKLVQTKEWIMVNLNQHPPTPMNCSIVEQRKTLQYLGCWPGARLEVLPNHDTQPQQQTQTISTVV